MPICNEFLDVFPIGNYKSIKTKFAFQYIDQKMFIDVSRHTVDLCRIDHHGSCTSLDGRCERRQEKLSQGVFRYERRCTISAARRKAVTDVMFQARRDMLAAANISALEPANKSSSHDRCKIWILTKCFPETRPHWLSPDIEHR